MLTFLTYTVAGLATAGIYAISASGLTLTYMTTGVFNFAHGAVGMVCAFCFWQLRYGWGVPTPLAWILCLLVLAPLLGLALEWGVMRRLEGAPETVRLVVTVALMLALVSLSVLVWNPNTFRLSEPLLSGQNFSLLGVRVADNDAIVLGISAAVAVGLWGLMFRTPAGVAMRATVDNSELLRLTGWEPQRSARLAWVVSTMLAGLAGILIAPTLTLSALPLTLLIVNAYAAAIIGRLRSLPMTFLGAVVLGLLTSYAVGYVQSQYLQGLTGTLPVILLFAALLLLRPSRLAGHQPRAAGGATPLRWRGGLGVGAGALAATGMLIAILSRADLFASAPAWGLAIVALSLVPLAGYAGRLSLCQLSFAGLGAVIVAHAGASVPTMLLAGVACGALGALVALPALRLGGIYLALATAAVALAFDRWIWQLPTFSVWGHRIDIFEGGTLTIGRPTVLGLRLDGSGPFLVFGAVVFAISTLVVVAIRRSSFGTRVLAISDSPRAAASLGLDVRRHTLLVFSLSAAMAGVGGAVYAMAVRSATPDSFSFSAGLPILLVMVVGGLDSIGFAALTGLVLGTPVSTVGPHELVPLVIGGLAVVIGRHPEGLSATLRARWADIATSRVAIGTVIAVALTPWALCVLGVIDTTFWLILTQAVFPIAEGISWMVRQRTGSQSQHGDVQRGLSAPVETLGLLAPFQARDIAVLDRAIGISKPLATDA